MIPPIADRFVAGERMSDAIGYTESINRDEISGILNLLGEHYHEPMPAKNDAREYKTLIERVSDHGVDACVSVKPSQIGVDLGNGFFEEQLLEIVDVASDQDVFVWVDMEDHTTTDVTLDAFEQASTRYAGVGVCVQSNLKRTQDDLQRLATLPGKVRLVKGAYNEPQSVAYQKKEQVNQKYRENLRYMFETFDGGIAVGSHDPEMIEYTNDLYEEYGSDFEIQMLMGVREEAQRELVTDCEVYQYVPYGSRWMSYFYRRVMERKENLFFALRAILQ